MKTTAIELTDSELDAIDGGLEQLAELYHDAAQDAETEDEYQEDKALQAEAEALRDKLNEIRRKA